MKKLAFAFLFLGFCLPPQAHAAQLYFECKLEEDLGGTVLRDSRDMDWSQTEGFSRPGGMIPLETADFRAEVTVTWPQGIRYKLKLIDKHNGTSQEREFGSSVVLRPLPEGHVAVSCTVDA